MIHKDREGEAPAELNPEQRNTWSGGKAPRSAVSHAGSAGASPSPLPQRHHPAHGVLLTRSIPTIVCLTVCTDRRRPWLATGEIHALLVSVWREADAWLLGRYVVMPEHIHLFAAPGKLEIPLDSWVQYWKSQFTKRHHNPEHRWQTDHWDRRLRSNERYSQKWDYIRNNPVERGLVKHPDDWPYQGELNSLEW